MTEKINGPILFLCFVVVGLYWTIFSVITTPYSVFEVWLMAVEFVGRELVKFAGMFLHR
jgi:hypothetical protein